MLATLALAAPPLPRLASPGPNGWAGPSKSFVLALDASPVLTAEFTHFQLEFLQDAGSLTTWSCTNSVGAATRTCTAPPGAWDAGDYTWRARTLDGGEVSAWTAEQAVRWDPEPPQPPASLSVDLVDGGQVQLSWPAAAPDSLSGIKEYHLGISYQPLDAGLNFDIVGSTTTGLARTFYMGPGTWEYGVHTHDVADNGSLTNTLAPTWVEVNASPTLAAPSAPFWVQGDGGSFLQTGGGARFRWETPLDGGVFVLAQRNIQADGGARPLYLRLNTSARETAVTQYTEGVWELLVAHALDGEVSDWSAPTRFMVEGRAPTTPVLVARVDGGAVSLSWNEVAEFGAVRSGLAGYRLSRCCTADASVALAGYDAGLPDGSLAFEDQPGPDDWRYEVRAFDRAGNVTVPAVALVTVRAPPVVGPPQVPSLTSGAVHVAWEDAGADVVYELERLAEGDLNGAGVLPAAAVLSFDDAPADGRWQYRVRGRLPPQDGPWSAPSAVVEVDSLPPTVSVTAQRTAPTEVQVSWGALDLGSGVQDVSLERQTAGLTTPLGPVSSSPFVDTPPDGAHAWRVVAVDRAGNRAQSPWTGALTLPGPFVQLTPPPPLVVRCGAPLAFQLEASGDAPITWALLRGPEGATLTADGALSWLPTRAQAGASTLAVRAQGAGSVVDGEVEVQVDCERRTLGLGFGCSSVDGAALLALLSLLRRPRSRPARGG